MARKVGELIGIIPPSRLEGADAGLRWLNDMKSEYDLSTMKSRRNPYASKLKNSVTMRLSEDVVEYLQNMTAKASVPYQSLINLYLRDCLVKNRKVDITRMRAARSSLVWTGPKA